MKKVLIGAMLSAIAFSATANADEEEVVYSTEAFCMLQNDGAPDNYLKAYAEKLGDTPSKKTCKAFRKVVESSRPSDWDYPGGRAYPGSIIKFSQHQVEILKAAKKKKK
ncbi:hypothetical protein PALB_34980 [Pseudoalteromonas luteoviolacea B = ATCC 29581]|nr:hypothetical protein PALB_34980 [Pseudoalteromonas luteoviolacea B = ATCC 29581]